VCPLNGWDKTFHIRLGGRVPLGHGYEAERKRRLFGFLHMARRKSTLPMLSDKQLKAKAEEAEGSINDVTTPSYALTGRSSVPPTFNNE